MTISDLGAYLRFIILSDRQTVVVSNISRMGAEVGNIGVIIALRTTSDIREELSGLAFRHALLEDKLPSSGNHLICVAVGLSIN